MASTTLIVNALVKVPLLSKWSGCQVETCLRHMYRVRNSFVVLMYATTIAAYVVISKDYLLLLDSFLKA